MTGTGGPFFFGDPSLWSQPRATVWQAFENQTDTPADMASACHIVGRSQGLGDSPTDEVRGLSLLRLTLKDAAGIPSDKRGAGYCIRAEVASSYPRDHSPSDDLACYTAQFVGGTPGAYATDAFYVANSPALGDAISFKQAYSTGANCNHAFAAAGKIYQSAMDFSTAQILSGTVLLFKSNVYIKGRANAGDDRIIIGLAGDESVQVGWGWPRIDMRAPTTFYNGTQITGGLRVNNGWFGTRPPVLEGGAFRNIVETDNHVTFNGAGCTVYLPSAAAYPGRELNFRTVTAAAVVSSAANVQPLAGGPVSTAILSATPGSWARVVSDGANWQIVQGA